MMRDATSSGKAAPDETGHSRSNHQLKLPSPPKKGIYSRQWYAVQLTCHRSFEEVLRQLKPQSDTSQYGCPDAQAAVDVLPQSGAKLGDLIWPGVAAMDGTGLKAAFLRWVEGRSARLVSS